MSLLHGHASPWGGGGLALRCHWVVNDLGCLWCRLWTWCKRALMVLRSARCVGAEGINFVCCRSYFQYFVFNFHLCVRVSSLAYMFRLVDALDDTEGRDRTWFVIHIDTKSNEMHEELRKVFIDRANVIVMEEGRCALPCAFFSFSRFLCGIALVDQDDDGLTDEETRLPRETQGAKTPCVSWNPLDRSGKAES